MLPESQLKRSIKGELVCKDGFCPERKSKQSAQVLELELMLRRANNQALDAKSGQERAMRKLEQVQDALDVALAIKDIVDVGTIARPKDPHSDEVCPIILNSDEHCGQVVKASAVNGLNEFNPDIYDERKDRIAQNAIRLINKERQESVIKEAVIWLGGDHIEGELHNDAVQSQTLTTTQQIVRAEKAQVRMLDYYLAKSDLQRIIIPCSVGNHGRNTKKPQSNSTENSYEWLMFHSLRKHYRDEPRLVWHIADSDCLYLPIYGHIMRFFHGDTVKYIGGAAGPNWNVDKRIKDLDQSIPALHTFHGHFHQINFGGRATGNGSLPSTAPYGHNQGYRTEAPMQAMRIFHPSGKFCGAFPIFAT
jgi:hypothetical protein